MRANEKGRNPVHRSSCPRGHRRFLGLSAPDTILDAVGAFTGESPTVVKVASSHLPGEVRKSLAEIHLKPRF
jgi:hypothetical protein